MNVKQTIEKLRKCWKIILVEIGIIEEPNAPNFLSKSKVKVCYTTFHLSNDCTFFFDFEVGQNAHMIQKILIKKYLTIILQIVNGRS